MSLWKPKYKDSNGNIQDLQIATNCLTDGTHLVKLPTLSDNAKVLTTDLTETGQTLDFSVSTSSGDIYSDNVFGYRQTATPFAQSKVQTKSSVVNIQKARAFGFVKNQLVSNKQATTLTTSNTTQVNETVASSGTINTSHRYLIYIKVNSISNNGVIRLRYPILQGLAVGDNYVLVNTPNYSSIMLQYNSSDGNEATISLPQNYAKCIDLTQWFNNDTTILAKTSETWFISWFLTNFGNKIPSTLNTGEVDFGWAKKIKTTNENIWDEEWQTGVYNISSGAYTENNSRICSKNFIPVIPNKEYYWNKGCAWVIFYNVNGNFIGSFNTTDINKFTTPNNCSFIHIDVNLNYGSTYNNDICINESNSYINGTYFKHEEWLFEMDWSFANSGSPRGINSTCGDEKDFVNGKNRVVVGSYTFTGNETWIYDENDIYYCEVLTGKKAGISNFIQDTKYITNPTSYVGTMPDKSISGYSGSQTNRLYVKDSETNASSLASYMAGKTINYELATPIETDMSESEKTFNSYIINTNGTEQLLDKNNEQTTGLLTNFYLENATKQIFNNLNEINGLISNYSNLSDKYLPLTGGTLSDNLIVVNGKGVKGIDTSSTVRNLIQTTNANSVYLGASGWSAIYSYNDLYPASTNNYSIGALVNQWNKIYGKTIYEDGTSLVSKYSSNYYLSIFRNDSGTKWVNFVTVNYSTYNENNGASFKLSAMSSHANGEAYSFLEDIIIGVKYDGTTSCTIYKYKQTSAGTVDGSTRYYGDIVYTINTVNKVVSFFILCGQYSSMQFTAFKKIGSTTTDGITQQTGEATYYQSGDKYAADGNKKTYSRTGECLPLTGGTLSGALNVNVNTANLITLKRLNNDGGAFIKYFNNNQDTNNWQVGMAADNGFKFSYNGTQTLYVNTAGKLIINNNSAIQYKNASGTPYNVINYNQNNNLVLGDSVLASSGTILSHYTIRPSAAASTIATVGTNDNPWKGVYGNYISGNTFEATSYYNTYGESVDLTSAYVVTDDEDDAYETRYGLRAIKNVTSNGTYKLTMPEKSGTIATMADVEGTLVEIVDLTTLND